MDPTNIANAAQAAKLYAQGSQSASQPGVAAPKGPSFSALLREGVEEAVNTLERGENVSARAILGQADLTEVVQAINEAELTLQGAIGIRDRMLQAYQEIMRMPI